MVVMMMAGVVRKKSRINRMQLMMKQRIHQEIPPSDRCSLQEEPNTLQQRSKGAVVLEVGGACGRTSGHSAGQAHTKHSSCEHEEPR